jgi:hypothetical protein
MPTNKLQRQLSKQQSQKVCVEQLSLNDAKANAEEHANLKVKATSVLLSLELKSTLSQLQS